MTDAQTMRVTRSATWRLGCAAALAASLSACASGRAPVTTLSLMDDYVMVRGVVTGRLMSPGIDREQVVQMVSLNHAALQALALSLADPRSVVARDRAQSAIRALSDVASSAPQSSSSVLVVRAGQH